MPHTHTLQQPTPSYRPCHTPTLCNTVNCQNDRKMFMKCIVMSCHMSSSDRVGNRVSRWPLSRLCEIPWQFHTIPWGLAALLQMLSVTHIMPVLVYLSVVGVGMQQCMIQNQNECTSSAKSRMDTNMQLTMNSFRPVLPDKIFSLTFPGLLVKSLTLHWQMSNSLTFPVSPDKW